MRGLSTVQNRIDTIQDRITYLNRSDQRSGRPDPGYARAARRANARVEESPATAAGSASALSASASASGVPAAVAAATSTDASTVSSASVVSASGGTGPGARTAASAPTTTLGRSLAVRSGGVTVVAGPAPTMWAPGPVAPAPSDRLAERLPAHGRHYSGAITDAAHNHGLDPALLAAVVRHESGFDPTARSRAGAVGLGQLMPGTAAELGVDPTDPLQNLDGSARYLRRQIDRFGSVELGLAAYNAGPARVAQAGGIPRIVETQDYVRKVVTTWGEYR